MTVADSAQFTTGSVTTNDGIVLRYVERGSGTPLVLVHGWSHTAKLFEPQLLGLSDRFRVIALDLRGHGYSDKPAHGMRVARLSRDLYEVLEALDVRDAVLLGHGMGAAVLWSYWDMFAAARVGKFVFVDQSPFATANPAMSERDMKLAGSTFDFRNLYSEVNGIAGVNGGAVTCALVRGMTTRSTPKDVLDLIMLQDFRLPRPLAATLLYDWATSDWRDTIPRIGVPTLVIGSKESPVPYESQRWIAERIPGARLELFEPGEGGHFMFLENPRKFNDLVAAFAV